MPPTAATSRSPLDLSRLLGCDRSGKSMTHDSAAAPPPVVPSSSPLPGVIWSVQTGLHRQEGLLSVLTWAWRLKAGGACGGHRGPQSFSWVLPSEGSSYLRAARFQAHTWDLNSAIWRAAGSLCCSQQGPLQPGIRSASRTQPGGIPVETSLPVQTGAPSPTSLAKHSFFWQLEK